MHRTRTALITGTAALFASALLCLPAVAAPGQASNAATTPEGFATTAGHINKAEVQLGQLAQSKASNPDVKAFGETMVQDHTQAEAKLKEAADKAGVTLPDTLDRKHQDLLEQLQQKSGAAFDTMYINTMVQGHEQAVQMLKEASAQLSSEPLKQWASQSLPIIQGHLERARAIQQKLQSSAPSTH